MEEFHKDHFECPYVRLAIHAKAMDLTKARSDYRNPPEMGHTVVAKLVKKA